MTLTTRLFLLVALAVAPTSALLIFDNYQRMQQREAYAEQEALRVARLVSAELDQIESLLRAAAQTPMVSAFQNPECTDYLRRLEGINPNSSLLVAVDATGLVRCGGTAGGINIADRAYFGEALKSDALIVGSYTVGRGSDAAAYDAPCTSDDVRSPHHDFPGAGFRYQFKGDRRNDRSRRPETGDEKATRIGLVAINTDGSAAACLQVEPRGIRLQPHELVPRPPPAVGITR